MILVLVGVVRNIKNVAVRKISLALFFKSQMILATEAIINSTPKFTFHPLLVLFLLELYICALNWGFYF